MNKIILLAIVSLLLVGNTYGQLPDLAGTPMKILQLSHADSISKQMKIGDFMCFFMNDSRKNVTLNDIKYEDFTYLPAQKYSLDSVKRIAYFRFAIQNTHLIDTLKVMLWVGRQKHLNLCYEPFSTVWEPSQDIIPTYIPLQKLQYEQFAFSLAIPPKMGQVFWIGHDESLFPEDFIPELVGTDAYLRERNKSLFDQKLLFGFLWLVLGVCVFLAVFGFIMFMLNKQIIYLWWGCYLSCNALFFVFTSDYIFAFPQLPVMGMIIPVQHLILLFYVLFFDTFFNFKENAPLLRKATIGLCVFIISLLFISIVLVRQYPGIWFLFIDDRLFFIVQFWFLGILFSSFFVAIPQKVFIISGSICLIVFSIWAVYIDTFGISDYTGFWTAPVCIYGLGFLVELVFLSLALSERAKFEQKDKLDIKQKLMDERIKYRNQIAQTEISALRAQMNPHFIFNCLNSIQLYTAQNNTEKATDYLTKFSRLIRLVLENSRSERVSLDNELETLRLYIEMEAMRFRGKVNYQINIAPTIETSYIQIPPLLLQPFVENAIWHGLMHKEEGGMIRIDVNQPNDNLLRVEITDDGVGREKAAQYKSKSATQNKSFGMKVTAERIELINLLYNTTTQVKIFDLKNNIGKATGTMVTVEIPI